MSPVKMSPVKMSPVKMSPVKMLLAPEDAARGAMTTRVGLELGSRWVFASALDWPGWCRRGKGEKEAMANLLASSGRYARVAGAGFSMSRFVIVGRVEGDATTDYGAPGTVGPWDDEPLDDDELARLVGLLESAWREFDEVMARPRSDGGEPVPHVQDAERWFARKVGVRIERGTPWPEQRSAIVDALLHRDEAARTNGWPVRYFIRRDAWHVLDHAWALGERRKLAG